MQIDAHYYAVLAFARACGYKKDAAHTLAYASQYVDDSKINHIAVKGRFPNLKNIKVIDDETHFLNMATCHNYFRSRTFNYSAMLNNTCAFHFVPGCDPSAGPNSPDDKKVVRSYRCRKKSKVIVSIIEDALNDTEYNSLVKFGIALHAYADSFSHHGFAGIPSKVNDIYSPKLDYPLITYRRLYQNKLRLFLKAQLNKIDMCITNYGHGQVFSNPDISHAIWSYKYDTTPDFTAIETKKSSNYKRANTLTETGKIENSRRYKEAFENVTDYLSKYLSAHEEIKDHNMFNSDGTIKFTQMYELYNVLTQRPKFLSSKTAAWIDKIKTLGLFDESDTLKFIEYDESKWLYEAFLNYNKRKFNHRSVYDVEIKNPGDFENSNWYKFYRAVYWYKPKFFEYCKKSGLNIPNDYLSEEKPADFTLAA